jgi:hypothetical protein
MFNRLTVVPTKKKGKEEEEEGQKEPTSFRSIR